MAKSGRFEHRECEKCKKHKKDIFIREPDGYYCRECHQFITEEKMKAAQILKRHDDPVEESEPLDSGNDPRRSGRSRKIIKKKAPSPDHLDADGNDSARSNEVPMKLLRMDSNKLKEKETRCSNQACAVDLISFYSTRHPITKKRICKTCYSYFRKHGKERSEEIVRRLKKMKQLDMEVAYKSCSNQACAVDLIPNYTRPHPITKEQVCWTCYCYFINHGKERSEEMVRRLEKKKQVDKEVAYKRDEPGVSLMTSNEAKEKDTRCSNLACAVDLVATDTRRHPITRKRVCSACHQYFKRTGKDRSEELVRRSKKIKLLDKEIVYMRDKMTSNELKEKETRCSNQTCAVDLVPTNTRRHPITKKRVCRACQEYFKRNGKERSEEKYCSNQVCAVDLIPYYSVRHPITRKRVCRACYQYVRIHGKDRSEEIVRHSKESKLLDKEFAHKRSNQDETPVLQNMVEDLGPTVVTNEVDQPLPRKEISSRPRAEIFEEPDESDVDEDPMIFYKDSEDSDESGLSRESEEEEEESSSEDELEYLRPFRPPKNTREDDEDEYLPNFMQQSLS